MASAASRSGFATRIAPSRQDQARLAFARGTAAILIFRHLKRDGYAVASPIIEKLLMKHKYIGRRRKARAE
jgi:hypothetical protein